MKRLFTVSPGLFICLASLAQSGTTAVKQYREAPATPVFVSNNITLQIDWEEEQSRVYQYGVKTIFLWSQLND